MSWSKVRLTQSRIGSVVRKLAVSCSTPPPSVFAGPQEHGDVGPAEPVDRLLRVADEEQPARLDLHLPPRPGPGVGIRRRDQHRQLDLDGIGVLELVEQEPLITVGGRRPHLHPVHGVAQHGPGQHQQVVELQLARPPALLGRGRP